MKKEEMELTLKLCSFNSQYSTELEKMLQLNATPTVLGQLFFNRMQAIAYGNLKKNHLLNIVNREFRNSLKLSYEQNIQRNNSYFECLKYLSKILLPYNNKYAMLKGALLCKEYPDGYRTSNDVDLLLQPKDVTSIGQALLNNGFKQGNIRNDEFIAATRKEIIESKMTRGETVPYIKEVDLPAMKYLEVDINFSLDYKNDVNNNLDLFINQAHNTFIGDLIIRTLDKYDFFIHICSHLYKEATTMPWIRMRRDMSLYKYCDVYFLIDKFSESEINCLFMRANELCLAEVCSFAIIQTASLFDIKNQYAICVAKENLKKNKTLLHTVVSPQDMKTFIYTEKNIKSRFFAENRIQLLKEI